MPELGLVGCGRMTTGDTVHVRAAAGPRTALPTAVVELLFAALTGAIAIAAAAYIQQLWHMRLQVPVFPRGDSLFTQAVARTVADHGWVTHNPSLGAPFGSTMQDLVVTFGDATQLALIRVLGLFSDSGPALVNVMYVLGFGLVGGAGYLLLRGLGLARGVSIAIGVVIALIRYHFERSEGHLFLGLYYAVPALAWLLYGVLGNHDLVRRHEGAPGWRALLSRRTALTAVLAVLVGASEVYYAVFGLAILALLVPITAATIGARRAGLVIALMAVIGTTALVVQLPSVLYHADHGANAGVTQRSPVESEVYGLRLAEMILPDSYHRFGPLARLGQKYFDHNAVDAEERYALLGTLGTLGFLGSLLVLLRSASGRPPRTREGRLVRDSGILALLAFLVATVSGFGAVFAYVISPQVRGWNRMSIVIACFALVAVAAALSLAVKWLRSPDRPAWLSAGRGGAVAAVALTVFVAWFGGWDQSSKALVPNYEGVLQQWRIDGRFVRSIDEQLPTNAMVLQLPYVPFPENPNVEKMSDYDQLYGYLHSKDLRWTYGAIKGRKPEDWGAITATLGAPELADRAAATGFGGIAVDTYGYADDGKTVVRGLAAVLGQPTARSADGRRVFFDLRPYAARQAANTSAAQRADLRNQLLHPVVPTFGAGFLPAETDGVTRWNWAGPTGAVTFSGGAGRGPLRVTFGIRTPGTKPSHVTVHAGSFDRTYTVRPDATRQVALDLPSTVAEVDLSTDAPDETSDPRDLHMQILDLQSTRTE